MAQSINHIIVSGNVGNEPQLRTTQNGFSVLNMSVANSRSKKDPQTGQYTQAEPNWINVSVYGKIAESLSNMLHKGSSVIVEGELRVNKFTKDGQEQYWTFIAANKVLLPPRPKDANQPNNSATPANALQQPAAPTPAAPVSGYADADIPF